MHVHEHERVCLKRLGGCYNKAESLTLFSRAICPQHTGIRLKQSQTACPSQLQLLTKVFINWHTINACAHMSRSLAAMCPPGSIHSLHSYIPVWVGDFSPWKCPCVRWLQICFPSRDRTCEQRGRTTATADGQLAHVTETIWRSAPLSKFIWNLHSAEMIQKMTLNWHSGREDTDELIYYDWIQHIFKLVIFYTGNEFHFMFLFSVIKNC